MRDDELMDQLLREAMAADVPRLSPGFDARVLDRVRPRRLTATGRLVIVAYAVAAATTAAWLMRDLTADVIVAAVAVTASVAIGASAYVRGLAAPR